DYRFHDNSSLLGRYSLQNDSFLSPFGQFAGSNIPGFGWHDFARSQNLSFGYTRILSSQMVADGRIAFARLRQPRYPENMDVDWASPAGFKGPNRDLAPYIYGPPLTSVTGYDALGASSALTQDRRINTYQAMGSLSITKGAHAMKFGGDTRKLVLN